MPIQKTEAEWLFEISVESFRARVAVALVAIACWAVLAVAMLGNFVSGALTDERVNVTGGLLASGLKFAPNSALLHARLAEVEMMAEERDLIDTELHARRAVNLSPWDYNHRLLLSAVEEAKGERAAAEKSMRDALRLAPGNTDVHWRLANLLFRQGKVAQSLGEFRVAAASDPSLLPGTLDLIWRASGGKPAAIEAVTANDMRSRLMLAQFLIQQARVPEAAGVVKSIDRKARLSSPQMSTSLNSLVARGYIEQARELWVSLISDDTDYRRLNLIWNGDFESEILSDFSQFDWTINRSEYARFILDKDTARTGSNSLRLDFLGRDTTRLDGEARQLVVVRPGARYLLECYAKSKNLVTTEGPRVVVTNVAQLGELGSSSPVAVGTEDWHRLAFDFVAPQGARAVYVTFRRVPKFSYDDPMRGSIWFDDFSLTEQREGR
ncbi:MAG TPA: tetratricopeptide repeat protein [Blastocatellia bacterium]